MFIVLHCGVTTTHPWIMSAAKETQLTLNILLPIVYFGLWNKINLEFTFQEYVCFGWLGWKHKLTKGRLQHNLFHVCFLISVKCEKIICSGICRPPPSKKLAHLGLRRSCFILYLNLSCRKVYVRHHLSTRMFHLQWKEHCLAALL